MHSGIRRVPAERARHAKRLGHVQTGPGRVFPVLADTSHGRDTVTPTTPTQQSTMPIPSQTSTVATPAVRPSSSAPSSSSSSIPSSSSAPPSSVATPSATSAGISTIASLTTSTSALSSSLPTPLVVLTSTSPTSSSTFNPQPNSAAVSHRGLSGGDIAGIIAGGAIVGAALIVFLVRKTYLRRRERKHISWNGAPGLGAGTVDEPKPFSDITERPVSFNAANTLQVIPPPSPFAAHSQPMYSTPVSPLAHIPPYVVPTPPPITYNNPASIAAYPTHPVPSTYGPGHPSTHVMTGIGTRIPSTLPLSVRAQHVPMEATVKCTFVPNLPDELSITTGERVFIVEQYDDGWDLCTNARGERGMVPRECLEHVPTNQPDIGWRNVGRTSSLNPDENRY